jgi:DNA-binding beta-propeller fold protein YncE
MMKNLFLMITILILVYPAVGQGSNYKVQKVDFLSAYGLEVNGAGPLLVRADTPRDRIVLVHTNTSSVSFINGSSRSVTNIPIKTRIPQYLKEEALAIDRASGNVYVIGNRCLHVVFPGAKESRMFATGQQYEMVAVNPQNGDAFLVGRESPFLARLKMNGGKVRYTRWVESTQPMVNLNQTPPPPHRKVVWDEKLNLGFAFDGPTAVLFTVSPSGRILKKRKVGVEGGEAARWHFAGYNTGSHTFFLVRETAQRKVTHALGIDTGGSADTIVKLPELSEGVGIKYNPQTDEVYIPYDNHPAVHAVSFQDGGSVIEIKIPAYGNDASAVDGQRNRLYVASWAYGEIEVIDLKTHRFSRRIRNLGIIPHMFNMAFDANHNKLYIPVGATAVNGSFGASLTCVNLDNDKVDKIYTGWAPVDLVEKPWEDGVLVFNSEDEVADVSPDGSFKTRRLPCRFMNRAVTDPEGNIFVAYGPHQSYWPVVYIWAAKNGILGFYKDMAQPYDRRIPRMAQQVVLDKDGALYGLQNNWGEEKQFIISLPDAIRSPNQGDMRLELDDKVTRETTQRILEYDPGLHALYIVRLAEQDDGPGIFQAVDLDSRKVVQNIKVGRTPTDLVFDQEKIYICNFDDDSLTIINKEDFTNEMHKTGSKPFKLALIDGGVVVVNHHDRSLQLIGQSPGVYKIPFPGRPDQLFRAGDELILTSHTPDELNIISFSPRDKKFVLIHREAYPFGETTVATDNTAFYVRGQFADGIFELNRIKQDRRGSIWITDYLSGKLFIVSSRR